MMKDVMAGVYTYDGEEFKFEYRTNISVKEKDIFVMNVCDIIVTDKDYHSLLKNMVFDFQLINMFTTVDLAGMDDVEDKIGWVETFIEETNIVDIVKANLKDGLLEELEKAIDINIEYRTGIHKNILNESLSDLVKTLKSKIENVDTESMMKAANVLSELSGELTPDSLIQAYINSGIYKED